MAVRHAPDTLLDPEMLFEGFENLMPFRVQDILLVTSLYDSFILREDGRLNELIIGESLELDLKHVPAITHVSSAAEAIALAKSQPRFNLIVANLYLADMDAAQLARAVKDAGLDVPVVVLTYDYREVKQFLARNPVSDIERIFLWQGNVRILISIVKYIEDKRNAVYDTRVMGVPVILVVEDNIRYYSSFLPVIYTELITQSRRVISEGLNVAHKLVRLRARPKILLCSNFEEAEQIATEHSEFLFGVISDVQFPRGGEPMTEAGFELAQRIHESVPDVPIALQSSHAEYMERAHLAGYAFLPKRSATLLSKLRDLLRDQFGFGDFVFKLADGTEVARANNMNELEQRLREVPAESIAYHSSRNHFSHWLMARTEFALAQRLRPRKVSDFATVEDLRRDLIDAIAEYRREQSEVLVGDFNPVNFRAGDPVFLRLGDGSLGGKARGLAFVRHLLRKHRVSRRYPNVRIAVPATLVLATDIFERFLHENDLLDFAMRAKDDEAIEKRFLAAPLPSDVQQNLQAYIEQVRYPIAVRSSSLLEDSQYQPFTGVYETFMLSNQHPDVEVRLERLMEAIKRVYASTFSHNAKAYVRATPYRLEEEKMAVMLQQVVGGVHGQRFYPDFAGVVRSRNFYPVPPMEVRDGIAAVALGLGRAVVEGGRCLAFCPCHPQIQMNSVDDTVANSQTEFWALEMDPSATHDNPIDDLRETAFALDVAERDSTLHYCASTYSIDNQALYDGLSRPGARIVTFAPILKYGLFPLASVLEQLMRIGEQALARPVEIEFAVRMPQHHEECAEFGFLQMRPLVLSREGEELRMNDVDPARVVCQSSKVLGHGRVSDLRDVVVVDFHRFERGRSQEVARCVSNLNAKLNDAGRQYLLIGVGRWGSNDPWLGIPVTWDEIAGARVIVEAGLRDFRVTPSQGSHFFQNLTAFQVGYFTVNPDYHEGFVDWEWLASQPAVEEQGCVRHLRFDSPIEVLMNGRNGKGMILKPRET